VIVYLLVPLFALATFLLARQVVTEDTPVARQFPWWFLGGFVLRLLANGAIRNLNLFSHGRGSSGDAGVYELSAWMVAQIWNAQGFQWVTAETIDIPEASNAMLAVHVYAFVAWLNGGEMSRIACVGLVAFLAAVTCLHLVRLGRMIGGRESDARVVALAMYFSPAFVFHTADTFKDGLSAFLVVSAVLVAFRLAERFNPVDLALGGLCLWALWYVRFYLVFLVSAPIALSLLGVRQGANARIVIASSFIVATGLVLIATQVADTALDVGVNTYERATSDVAMAWNQRGGSGVAFTGMNPWLAFPLKLIYTLFSPFLWDFRSTSVGFQVGKIDALIGTFFLFRGGRAARRMWDDDRGTLLMFLAVVVPLTVAYATTMANIGLIVRQRIPIIMLGSVLAVRGLPAVKEAGMAARGALAARRRTAGAARSA